MSAEQRLLFYRAIDEASACWNFTGYTQRGGYPSLWALGRRITAHRLAAILWLRMDLKGRDQVLHTCDNRRCFNPDHLYLGTHEDNMRDRKARGRYAQPARNRKLNWDAVRLIRELHFKGYSKRRLARAFAVGHMTIQEILTNQTWQEVV